MSFEPIPVELDKVLDFLEGTYKTPAKRWRALRELLDTQKAAQHRLAGGRRVCTCKYPVPTTSSDNHCGNCGLPRRR